MDNHRNLQLQTSFGGGINYDSGIESSPTSQISFEQEFDAIFSPGFDMSWLNDFPRLEDYLIIPDMMSTAEDMSNNENLSTIDEGIGMGTKINEYTSDWIALPRVHNSAGADTVHENPDSLDSAIQSCSEPDRVYKITSDQNASVHGDNEPAPMAIPPTNEESTAASHDGTDKNDHLMLELFGDDEPEVSTVTQQILPHGLDAVAAYNAQHDNKKQTIANDAHTVSHKNALGHDDWLKDEAEFRRIALKLGDEIDALRGRATTAISKNKSLLQQVANQEVSVQQIAVQDVPITPQEIVNLTPAAPPVVDPKDREYIFGWDIGKSGIFKFFFDIELPGNVPISEVFSIPLPTIEELKFFKNDLDGVRALNGAINEEIWFYRMLMQQAYNCINAAYIAEIDFTSFIISMPGAEDRYNAWADAYNKSSKVEGFYNVHSEQVNVVDNQNTEDVDAIGEEDNEMADLTDHHESYTDESDMIDSLLDSPMDCAFDSALPSPSEITISKSTFDIDAVVASCLAEQKANAADEPTGFQRDIVPNLFAPGSDDIPTFNVGNFLDEELSNITIGDPDGKVRAKNLVLIKRAYDDVMHARGPEKKKMCRLCFYPGHTEISNINECPAARLNSWIHQFPLNGPSYYIGMTENLGPIDQFFYDKGAISSAFQWVSHAVHCGVADELGFNVQHAERLQDLFLKCHELHTKDAIINTEEMEECDPANATIAVGRLKTQHVLSEGVIVLKRPPLIAPDGILFNQGKPVYPGDNDGAPEQESEETSPQPAAPKKKRKRAASKTEPVYNEVCDKAGLPHLGDRKNSVCANCSYRGHIVNSVKTCPYAIVQECNQKIEAGKGWRHDMAKYEAAAKHLEKIIDALDEIDDRRAENIQAMLEKYLDKTANADVKTGQKRKSSEMSPAAKKVCEESELTVEQLEANVQQALSVYGTAPEPGTYRTLRKTNMSSLALKNCLVRYLPIFGNRPDTQCPNCHHFGHDQRGKSCPLSNVREALKGNDKQAWNECLQYIPSLVNAQRFFSCLPTPWSGYARNVNQLTDIIEAIKAKYEKQRKPVVSVDFDAMSPELRALFAQYIS
ncbi:hypothetical protein FPQ18DRAFT_380962 [Pyronema domesticum]|nr:hypothetical protein FPQ18DRAFT_380962 [Pyronema domesticum]